MVIGAVRHTATIKIEYVDGSVRIFANCLSVVSFNSTMLVTWAIRTALHLNNIRQRPKTVRTL